MTRTPKRHRLSFTSDSSSDSAPSSSQSSSHKLAGGLYKGSKTSSTRLSTKSKPRSHAASGRKQDSNVADVVGQLLQLQNDDPRAFQSFLDGLKGQDNANHQEEENSKADASGITSPDESGQEHYKDMAEELSASFYVPFDRLQASTRADLEGHLDALQGSFDASMAAFNGDQIGEQYQIWSDAEAKLSKGLKKWNELKKVFENKQRMNVLFAKMAVVLEEKDRLVKEAVAAEEALIVAQEKEVEELKSELVKSRQTYTEKLEDLTNEKVLNKEKHLALKKILNQIKY